MSDTVNKNSSITIYIKNSYNSFKNFLNDKIFNGSIIFIDKVKLILYVTWLWALLGLYLVKIFEFIFKMILSIPNNLLEPLTLSLNNIKTSKGKNIELLNAYDEYGNDVTNKVKLFLNFFWGENINDKNYFSFVKLSDLLSISVLYCSYIVQDENTDSCMLINNIKRMFLEKEDKDTNISFKSNLSDKKKSMINLISFDEEEENVDVYQQIVNDIMNDIDSFE